MVSRRAVIAALAALGIVLTVAITFGTSQLVRQRIGLASEPLSAGQRLLPAPTKPSAPTRPTRTGSISTGARPTGTGSTRTAVRPTRTASAPQPTQTIPSGPAGGDESSGSDSTDSAGRDD